ncbi:hypothetical protein [Castellaniella sp. GW247-6E4]|uniref:hypothetical protein n=1 Tax=Castellaniella sp. GW247-6E4 TaxID=3140380 RepID=UPI00331564DC
MDKQQALDQLEKFKDRLVADVASAYSQRGSDFGRERFAAWRRQIDKFLDENFPGARAMLDRKLHHGVFFRGGSESDYDVFMREDGEPSLAFIDSLRLDIGNDEYDFSQEVLHQNTAASEKARGSIPKDSTRVFIVHGHDEALRNI